MKPKIYAKSSFTKEQADVKLAIGCDGLEIQLLGELFEDGNLSRVKNFRDVFDINGFKDYNIEIIHMPLVPGMGDVLLEALMDDQGVDLFISVFQMAEEIAKMQGHSVGIVIHSESFYEKLLDEDVWERIVRNVSSVMQSNPHVNLIIENVSPLRGIGKGKTLHLANNFAFDNVEMVRRLREETKCDRIFTCLDICHAMLAQRYITILYVAVGDVPVEDLTLERYFEENKDVIGLIHLSTIAGSGYGKDRHGVPIRSLVEVEDILQYYTKYRYNCPITLEVEEADFSVCDGYAATKEVVDAYFYQETVLKGNIQELE